MCVCFCVRAHTLPPLGDHPRLIYMPLMFVLPVTPSMESEGPKCPHRPLRGPHPTCLQRKVPGALAGAVSPLRTHPQLLRTHGCIPRLQGLAALLLFSEEETSIPKPASADTRLGLPVAPWSSSPPRLGLRLGCDPPRHLSVHVSLSPLCAPSSLPQSEPPLPPPHSPLHRSTAHATVFPPCLG